MATNVPVTGETPIAIKISVNDSLKKLKLPLKDLTADALFIKLRTLLTIPSDKEVLFERFSDSAGGYITLDQSNPAVFKTLVRAAKAKLKLRLRATVKTEDNNSEESLDKENTLVAQLPEVPKGPVVSRAPMFPSISRTSTTLDGHSGPGIFEFKDARASKQAHAAEEAPVPLPFTEPAQLALRIKPAEEVVVRPIPWSIYCNECDAVMLNEHFHCSICDGGDYDLCTECVQSGRFCPGEGHWLVKRSVQNGQVLSSTTERLAPKPRAKDIRVETSIKTEVEKDIPGAFTNDLKTLIDKTLIPSRTCNNCVSVYPEGQFVTCNNCEDFDLCFACHVENKHGHHPAHTFGAAVVGTKLSLMQQSLLTPGRNARHHAICDGCNKNIYGIRHKCFNCPDFDYCDSCFKNSTHTHAGHRFAPLYEPVAMPLLDRVKHHGIYCDGPACTSKSNQTYIQGVRYKCVICHDTDFCADCEAAPGSMHNPTHPLIKMKRPIKGLNVSTMNETQDGKMYHGLGDRGAEAPFVKTAKATEVSSSASTLRAPSSVSLRTVADIEPLADQLPKPVLAEKKRSSSDLSAIYIRDTVTDGTAFTPGSRFTQVWTLRNPGPQSWPAGCSVRFIGGDNMLNLEDDHASSASAVAEATESNVIGREVQKGEEIAFKVIMKAPTRQGKAISYWRLKAADGTPFGHRLWCDINVKAENAMPQTDSWKRSRTLTGVPGLTATQRVPQSTTIPPNAPNYYSQHLERMKTMQEASRENAVNLQSLKARLQRYHHQHKQAQTSRQSCADAMAGHDHWLKQMESFVNQTSSSPMLIPSPATSKSSETVPSETKPVETTSAEVKVEEPEKKEQEKTDNLASSLMVFPTLDKESPSSSTYLSADVTPVNKGKAASVEDEETGSVSSAALTAANRTSDSTQQVVLDESSVPSTDSAASSVAEDEFEDVASEIDLLSADGDLSEDDGFLTDEEYDVLDASDQETIASA